MEHLQNLSRQELVTLIDVHAKCWLAHDGCWFLAVEDKYGLDVAMELDTRSWERFSPIEARRIMQAFDIPEGGGLDALEKALRYRLYATVNPQAVERPDQRTLIYKMVECRVQSARRRKGLPDFPCKPVGLVEYSRFAETIDLRIKTRCLQCPPDDTEGTGCICTWEFTV
ncbi:MAG TPA: DUF6125 family protein [Phycisphaerae bacterium]|nr:DUF6125 family protein [Phycisphaerae bacterium]